MVNDTISTEIYNQMLTFPTKSDRAIAKELNLGNSTVSRYRRKLVVKLDNNLVRNVTGKFLTHFQMASDYFMKQIEIIEKKKNSTKTTNIITKDGESISLEEELTPTEYLNYEKQQTELWKNILFLCRQPEVIEVVKRIQKTNY